jgi:hypothetical protein
MNNPPLKSFVLFLILLTSACGDDAPTGVSTGNLEGVWGGRLNDATLLGRSLNGDVEWQFTKDSFELRFFDPPAGQAERIAGSWKFSSGKVVLELRTSFPISDDIGATDSLFVSIVNSDISIKTLAGSDILLRKIRSAFLPDIDGSQFLCRFPAQQVRKPSGSTFPQTLIEKISLQDLRRGKYSKRGCFSA